MASGTTQPCPQCGATLPVVPPYRTWCHACGWNIAAAERPLPAGRFERLYEQAGRRAGERLEREFARADELEPRLTPTKLAAFAIAGSVHLLTLLLVAGGAVLIARFPTRVFGIAAGILMIATALVVRPRLGKPPDENLIARTEAPSLFRLVDEVASAVGAKTVDILVVDDRYNASWSVLGVRRRRVLTLGLPLFMALDDQERVSLIAHELAHARNGDSTRGLFVGSAINGLLHWHVLLSPQSVSAPYGLVLGAPLRAAEWLANGVLWLLSRPPLLLFYLEIGLLLQDSRRAEFLADAIAAQVSGTDAEIAVHEKLLLESTFEQVVRQYAHPSAQRDAGDVFDAVRAQLDTVPQRERERRRRVAMLEASSLGATHPPTGQRIRLLEQRQIHSAAVVLTQAESAEIDRELGRVRPTLGRRLIENERARLYRR